MSQTSSSRGHEEFVEELSGEEHVVKVTVNMEASQNRRHGGAMRQ